MSQHVRVRPAHPVAEIVATITAQRERRRRLLSRPDDPRHTRLQYQGLRITTAVSNE